MDFSVVGPLEVRVGGRALTLGGTKPRCLLALLLLHPAGAGECRADRARAVGRGRSGVRRQDGSGARLPATPRPRRGRGPAHDERRSPLRGARISAEVVSGGRAVRLPGSTRRRCDGRGGSGGASPITEATLTGASLSVIGPDPTLLGV